MAPTIVKKGKKVVRKGGQIKIKQQMVATCMKDPKIYDSHGDPHNQAKVNLYNILNLEIYKEFNLKKKNIQIFIKPNKKAKESDEEDDEEFNYDEVSFHPNYDGDGCECDVTLVEKRTKRELYITQVKGCKL